MGDTAVACALADTARRIARSHFRAGGAVTAKADASPVTAADVAAEDAMRALLAEQRPGDGVVGEERPPAGADRNRVWHIDPLDGTRAFACGHPVFAALIALVVDGDPVLGVIEMPALGERWVGRRGVATTHRDARGERRVRTRACRRLADAWLTTTRPCDTDRPGARIPMMDRVAAVSPGGESLNYGLVASGWCDLALDTGLDPHDTLPLVPVIEGAGGAIAQLGGAAVSDRGVQTVIAAATPALHAEALAAFAGGG